jgi:propionyl-CoA carboxylase alpha chain
MLQVPENVPMLDPAIDRRRISKVLIANRGEIALRVMRTCHAMGIATVAVHSEVDAAMPFVAAADEAIEIGGAAARDSYLAIEKILAAARVTGANAIHPGYGFLSENSLFAEACDAAGVIFIGPSAEVIRKLGAKREAKRLAAAAGVPIVPGYAGTDQSVAAFVDQAEQLGLPLLLKASAGGGGKGMHVVRSRDQVAAAVERAKREASAAFGDDTLLLERYVERPRHVEVQILGDRHGNLIHLHERECSIQRRHQKILEESPSPTLSETTRAAMCQAAVALGKSVGYSSAGTVEFIVDRDGAFYFLEVNTRLQVEHPVTELTCNIDLVAEQIRIARGEPLRWSAAPPQRGHAIEVRLCAEDPEREFLPTSGQLVEFHVPVAPGVRCDMGVVTGSEIGIHYDSMLGKIIAHADTRAEAADMLRRVLQRSLVAGVVTNLGLLVRLLGHSDFLAADLDTHFLERHVDSLQRPLPSSVITEAVVAATLAGLAIRGAARTLPAAALGWRNVPYRGTVVRYCVAGQDLEVRYQLIAGDRLALTVGETLLEVSHYRQVELAPGERAIEFVIASGLEAGLHSQRWRGRFAHRGDHWWVCVDGETVALIEQPRFPEGSAAVAPGSLLAPMPGKVVSVLVAVGDVVAASAPILMLEAMKMEHTIRAAAAGTVVELRVVVGDQVAADTVLAVVASVVASVLASDPP